VTQTIKHEVKACHFATASRPKASQPNIM